MTDRTNYAQSLMHMIKGNLGTGILAMPASFAHLGLYNAFIGLPILCIIATYCVHLLVKSTRHLEGKTKNLTFKYASLAKHSFKFGPIWLKSSSQLMCSLVDGTLLIAQIGVCCVYIVFIVDNITSILSSYNIKLTKISVFIGVFPFVLSLSYVRTLRRLAIASGVANLLQALGISIVLEYLSRDISKINFDERRKFSPFNEAALGFGSAMFAFEGISVVLPVYTRMKDSNKMSGFFGVVNLTYGIMLILYFLMGLFGYLKFGNKAGDSITLNLPPEPLYDLVRAMFTISVMFTYPLQFYVPNEIIWAWAKKNILMIPKEIITLNSTNNSAINLTSNDSMTVVRALEVVIPALDVGNSKEKSTHNQSTDKVSTNDINLWAIDKNNKTLSLSLKEDNKEKEINKTTSNDNNTQKSYTTITTTISQKQLVRYEYYCRTIVVIITFVLAISVPKLNLLMDLIGSITGTVLSLILPAVIHMAAFWDDMRGFKKVTMILVDSLIIAFGIAAGLSGTIFSASSIIKSFS